MKNDLRKVARIKAVMLILLMTVALPGFSQIWKDMGKKVEKKVEQKASQRLERKIDRTIDKTLDKVEEAPKEAKKKDKKSSSSKESTSETPTKNDPSEDVVGTPQEGPPSAPAEESAPDFKKFSQFTFVPGEQVIAFDDFSQDAIGDLPASWVSTGTSEVVHFEHVPGNWVWFNKTSGNFVPEYLRDFPENFTLEFDIMHDFAYSEYSNSRLLTLVFSDIAHPEAKLDWIGSPSYFFIQPLSPNYVAVEIDGRASGGGPFINGRKAVTANKSLNFSASYKAKELFSKENKLTPVHISIARMGRRMQVFANETKVLDMTNAFERDTKLTSARFFLSNQTDSDNYYLSNIRYAVGKPDTRNKLLSSGRFTTNAITFASGSAQLKGESYGILKEIATALNSEPSRAVTIIGHTDSDGAEAHNKQLSEKRAEAVRRALADEFGVKNEMMTEGQGESNPVADNATSSGKAQNRRVEFILKP